MRNDEFDLTREGFDRAFSNRAAEDPAQGRSRLRAAMTVSSGISGTCPVALIAYECDTISRSRREQSSINESRIRGDDRNSKKKGRKKGKKIRIRPFSPKNADETRVPL